MRVVNLTSLPNREVRAAVRLARGRIPSDGLVVAVRRGRSARGRYYPPGVGRWNAEPWVTVAGKRICNEAGYVTIYLPRRYPARHGPHYGCDVTWFIDWREALVHVAAHELYHHRQYLRWRERGRSSWPSLSQGPAERYAVRRLAAWRGGQPEREEA
jgi:hypothetical protein